MAEVRLRKDFYGSLIPKVSSDSLRVNISFSYQGPAQVLDIETNTGKRGAWGGYDQESPAYHDSKAVSASDTPRSYTFSRYIPLSFWGLRQIDDGAVEVVIRGTGVYDDAVLWNAYTIAPAAEYTLDVSVATPAVGYVTKSPNKAVYTAGETVTLTAYLDSWAVGSYVLDHWVVNGVARAGNPISITMNQNTVVTAHFIWSGAF